MRGAIRGILFLSLFLAHGQVFAEGEFSGESSKDTPNIELSRDEAKKYFDLDFFVSGRTVLLTGVIPRACAKREIFEIRVEDAPLKGNDGKNYVGYRFIDKGGKAKECFKKYEGKICNRDREEDGSLIRCAYLSKNKDIGIVIPESLPNKKPVYLGVFHNDPNKDSLHAPVDAIVGDSGKPVAFEDVRLAEARARAALESERDADIRVLKQTVSRCRGSRENREKALSAAFDLVAMGEMTVESMEKLQDEQDMEEIAELRHEIQKQKGKKDNIEDLFYLREKLRKLSYSQRERPRQSMDLLANAYYDLAVAFSKSKGQTPTENWDEAQATIDAALEVEGFNERTRSRFETYASQLLVVKGQSLAASGDIRGFYNFQQAALREASQRYMEACSQGFGTYDGMGSPSNPECNKAAEAMRNIAGLTDYMRQVQAQKAQLQQQMAQLYQQSQNPGIPNGTQPAYGAPQQQQAPLAQAPGFTAPMPYQGQAGAVPPYLGWQAQPALNGSTFGTTAPPRII